VLQTIALTNNTHAHKILCRDLCGSAVRALLCRRHSYCSYVSMKYIHGIRWRPTDLHKLYCLWSEFCYQSPPAFDINRWMLSNILNPGKTESSATVKVNESVCSSDNCTRINVFMWRFRWHTTIGIPSVVSRSFRVQEQTRCLSLWPSVLHALTVTAWQQEPAIRPQWLIYNAINSFPFTMMRVFTVP